MGTGASVGIAEALGSSQENEDVLAMVHSLSASHHTKLRIACHADRQEAICDEGHLLQIYTVPCSGFCCERCGEDLEEGSRVWQCEECGNITIGVCCSLPMPPATPTAEPHEEPTIDEEFSDGEDKTSEANEGSPQVRFVNIEGSVDVEVCSLGGFLCTFHADANWTIKDVKNAIEDESGVAAVAQNLLCCTQLLEEDDQLGHFGQVGQGNSVCLTLLERSLLQVEWLRKIRDNVIPHHEMLEKAPLEVCEDRFVVLAAVTQYGRNLRFAGDDLKADEEIVVAAMQNSPEAFSFAAQSLRDEREFVLKSVALHPFVYRLLEKELRQDRDIAQLALLCGQNLEHAPDDIIEDAEMRILAVRNGFTLKRARGNLRDHFWLAVRAVCHDPEQLRWVPLRLQEDHYFALNLVESNGNFLRKLPEKHMRDAAVVKVARENGFQGDIVRRRSGKNLRQKSSVVRR